jgi:hypothetical protein
MPLKAVTPDARAKPGVPLEQINIENVYLLCRDLLANPCREIVARRIYFAVKQQSQT